HAAGPAGSPAHALPWCRAVGDRRARDSAAPGYDAFDLHGGPAHRLRWLTWPARGRLSVLLRPDSALPRTAVPRTLRGARRHDAGDSCRLRRPPCAPLAAVARISARGIRRTRCLRDDRCMAIP